MTARKILLIGIGAGDPGHLTIQAVEALRRTDVFFVLDKGEVKQELVDLRQHILDTYVPEHRVVTGRDPERDRGAEAYVEAVDDWRRRRADVCEAMFRAELADGGTGAFLVWGDPTLYDSTLAIVEDLRSRDGLDLEIEVIPGISSVSALVARHQVSLTQTAKPVQVTTGRRLAKEWPADVDDLVVMLDGQTAFTEHLGTGATIYWGAYLGTPDELLIAGPLDEVADEIVKVRAEARERKGWIMDTYLLRR